MTETTWQDLNAKARAEIDAVFDPNKVADQATCDNPSQHAVVGFRAALVNGVVTVNEGRLVIDAAAGQLLRRPVGE